MRKLFLRSFAIAFMAFALLFGTEFFLEWRRAGSPGAGDMSWAGVNNAKLVDILSPMARAYNNVLAMLIATIGLAIPLTANMHTPKLIEMFLRDRVNRYVLSFMALGGAHVLWVDYMVGPKFAPTWAIAVAVMARAKPRGCEPATAAPLIAMARTARYIRLAGLPSSPMIPPARLIQIKRTAVTIATAAAAR